MVSLHASPWQNSYYPITIGCSSILPADYGTENSNIAAVQIAMRYNHDDPMAREKSFMYGPSKYNAVGVLRDNSYFIFILFVCLRDLKMVGPISEVKD